MIRLTNNEPGSFVASFFLNPEWKESLEFFLQDFITDACVGYPAGPFNFIIADSVDGDNLIISASCNSTSDCFVIPKGFWSEVVRI